MNEWGCSPCFPCFVVLSGSGSAVKVIDAKRHYGPGRWELVALLARSCGGRRFECPSG
jgi:hypothetical protein